MAEGNELDAEMQHEDLEYIALSQNWQSIKGFLKDIETRQTAVMSTKIKELINSINQDIKTYLGKLEQRYKIEIKKEEERSGKGHDTPLSDSGSDSDLDDDRVEGKGGDLLKSLVKKLDNRNSPEMETVRRRLWHISGEVFAAI